MLINAARHEWDLDEEVLLVRVDARLVEMLIVLEDCGLQRNALINDRYIARIEAAASKLHRIREHHRRVCLRGVC